MATIDLGKISFVDKGTWSNSTAYTERDVVQYTDSGILSSYVAVASSTNQAPSSSGTANSSYWSYLAKGGANGSNGTNGTNGTCLLYTSPSPRDRQKSRMPSSA